MSHPLRVACLAAAVVIGLVLLLPGSTGNQPRQGAAPHQSETSSATPNLGVSDPAWSKLTWTEQQTLRPLLGVWSTMTVEQQEKWRLVVARVHGKPDHVQRRLEARIQHWARLTPEQRAHARLAFLEVTKGLTSKQKKDKWQAYQRLQPQPRQPVVATASRAVAVPPGLVRAAPGATTVLLSQLFKLPATDEAQRPPDPAHSAPLVDRSAASWPEAASAPAGNAVQAVLGGS